ncbi:hypothetical protein [Meridianimarinicoccus sp. MJW13]|uniref:hypothetical protein n=1 Tax=Meridianimarinicoccus sp. MJW13 TaxID=2720031 RepID=UPI0018695939|nr:hypothetical protein [Fluviibacterium sp. MJW13]
MGGRTGFDYLFLVRSGKAYLRALEILAKGNRQADSTFGSKFRDLAVAKGPETQLCGQATELILKAAIEVTGEKASRTHNLDALSAQFFKIHGTQISRSLDDDVRREIKRRYNISSSEDDEVHSFINQIKIVNARYDRPFDTRYPTKGAKKVLDTLVLVPALWRLVKLTENLPPPLSHLK